ncbi:MAG: EamA family transporter [Candidatus Bathyarchaeota archaeon]|nr:MAG: EamA family transporter [Candidatus Bathyarchaeota archaeon]
MTDDMEKPHMLALAEALLVTFLWSSSYVLIEIGLEQINPLAFAAYRYAFAAIILSVFLFYKNRKDLINLSLRRVLVFVILGFAGYFIAQGLQFLGLYYLEPVTVSFLLNLTPIIVLVLSGLFLNERPKAIQLFGIALTSCGVFAFFYDTFGGLDIAGVLLTLISGVGWASYMIISRHYLSQNRENVITLTTCSMVAGSVMLLGATTLTGNNVSLSFDSWLIIGWLSVANTAFAFALWNHALKTLMVYEQSILQNTMLIQVALLSFVFLHDPLTLQKILGMGIVFIGVLVVQLGHKE